MIDGYVYKQTAINAICQDWCNRDYCGDCFFHGAKQAIAVLKALPSADVVKVVRCRDCKFGCYDIGDRGMYCGRKNVRLDTYEDDYCSFAERKDGEQKERW